MLRSANVATPLTAAAVCTPESAPPPGLLRMATVTLPAKLESRLLNGSCAITSTAGVMKAPAVVVEGFTWNASCVAAAAVTVTAAVCVTVTPFTVADTVFVPATVELNVPVATPAPSVGAGWVTELPPPEALRKTVAPLTGLRKASRAVTVIVEALDPELAVSADGAADSVDWPADTAPAVTVTVAACASARPFTVADTLFVSAKVDASVPVAVPLGSVPAAGWVSVLPVPVVPRTTVAPAIGLPNWSRAMTVRVDVPAPATIVAGLAESVDCVADTASGVPVAVNVAGLPPRPGAVAASVLLPAAVPSVQPPTVAIPLASVTGAAPVTRTAGAIATAVLTVAVWPSPATIASCEAAPGATSNGVLVAGVRGGADAERTAVPAPNPDNLFPFWPAAADFNLGKIGA